MADELEFWMRGPVDGIPPLLMPVAHALLQVRKEVQDCLHEFDEALLWKSPAGLASAGFHLQHLSGFVDRLFTYARGEKLSEEQFAWLHSEGKPKVPLPSSQELFKRFSDQVDSALIQLSATDESILLEPRGIGRQQLPTNVIGLLFHAAEHAQRHSGQLLVTVRILV